MSMLPGMEDAPSTSSRTAKTDLKEFLIWVAVILFALCICTISDLPSIIKAWKNLPNSFAQMETDHKEITAVLHDYFSALRDGDLEAAYQLYAPRVVENMSYAEFSSTISDSEIPCIGTYLGVHVRNMEDNAYSAGPYHPKDDATVDGDVLLDKNLSYQFDAGLMLVDGTWMVNWVTAKNYESLVCNQ